MTDAAFTATKQKEFIFELVVSEGDITPYGSASFVNYVRWYNIARDALLQWRNLGFEDTMKHIIQTEVSFCNIQYKREAMLQDEIIIKINSSEITDRTFNLLFTIIRKDNALLISLGKQKISFRNLKTNEIINLKHSFIKNVLRSIEVDEKTLLFKYE
ncbi:MAG: acyl-CoA thioesterase [Candidatus Omnitrophica bacterium]|nr:acyl-CoA thioesterase [Candidatus Omnitrophota bacterium]